VTQVNLLPPEIRQRAIIRRNTFLIAAAGVLLVGLMVLLYFVQVGRLSGVNDQISAQEATNTSLKNQAAQLSEFASLKAEADAKRAVLTELYANEVSMSSLLQDVSNVMPSDSYLSSLSVSIDQPGAGTPSTGGTTTFIGQVTFAGQAYRSETFPIWLDRIGSITGFENPFLNAYSEAQPGSLVYQFQSSVNLSADAMTARGARGAAALDAAGGGG
jgi:Tfp pilus assembly protein PilN